MAKNVSTSLRDGNDGGIRVRDLPFRGKTKYVSKEQHARCHVGEADI